MVHLVLGLGQTANCVCVEEGGGVLTVFSYIESIINVAYIALHHMKSEMSGLPVC